MFNKSFRISRKLFRSFRYSIPLTEQARGGSRAIRYFQVAGLALHAKLPATARIPPEWRRPPNFYSAGRASGARQTHLYTGMPTPAPLPIYNPRRRTQRGAVLLACPGRFRRGKRFALRTTQTVATVEGRSPLSAQLISWLHLSAAPTPTIANGDPLASLVPRPCTSQFLGWSPTCLPS